MKKLLLLVFFMVGLFTVSNAQFLVYSLTNSSNTYSWDYVMTDAGSGILTTEAAILPGTSRSGAVPGFGFDLKFKAQNSLGCGTGQVITGPSSASLPVPCIVPAGLKYKISVLSPFVTELQMKFG